MCVCVCVCVCVCIMGSLSPCLRRRICPEGTLFLHHVVPPHVLLRNTGGEPQFGLYKTLSLPILCGTYCNNEGSGGHIILRNSVGEYRGVGCLNKGWMRRE